MQSKLTKRYVVSGIVQGVGYRYFAQRAAQRLGLIGFARNLADGRVEIIAEGSEEKLTAFGEELQRGPIASRVDGVSESEPAAAEAFTAFTIRG